MGLKVYLSLAVGVFIAATTGADLFARSSVAGQSFPAALCEHLYLRSAGEGFVGTIFLLAPFITVAYVCARFEKQTRGRSVAIVFGLAMTTLLYFYFYGHQDAQQAMLERRWTAAALSIGLLPFFVGIPVIVAVIGAGALAKRFDS